MARSSKRIETSKSTPKTTGAANGSRTLTAAAKGVKTSSDFKNYMSGLMSDLVTGKVAPQTATAVCNAGGKLLKVVEMEYKYGRKDAGLVLTGAL